MSGSPQVPAELLAQVDRRETSIEICAGSGTRPREVEHRDAPRRRELDRRDVDPQQPVEVQQAREVLALAEEQRRLLTADRNDRDDSHAVLEREPHEAGPVGEVDLDGVPTGPVGLVIAARINEQRTSARRMFSDEAGTVP